MPIEGEWLARLGAEVVDEVVNYQDVYRLCDLRGPEGLLIGLAQEPQPPPAARAATSLE